MIKNYLLFLLAGTITTVNAQNIEVINSSLNFPDATELTASYDTLLIYNPGMYTIEVEDIDLFTVYGDYPFTVVDTAFQVLPKDTHKVEVTFLPEHNITHELILIVKTNTGFGHVVAELKGQGEYSNPYYSSTENLAEENLKMALKTRLAQGYNSLGYNTARDNMYATIDNRGGDVTCVYTARTATFNTRAGANTNGFNTEHTFPQGFFNQNEPMRSDIHALFPTDATANSTRSNHPFGIVSNPSNVLPGGSKYGSSTFEPRDPHKGACARAMMYFVIRYQDYANHFSGQENILRQWHKGFPVGNIEVARNDAIATLQGNRNPFVDYPQLEERITSFVSTSSTPSIDKFYLSDDTIYLANLNSGLQEYSFVFYNEGNTDINLSNFALNDPGLSFSQGPLTTLLVQPGENLIIRITYDSQKNYSATLDFSTDVSGQGNLSIPIRSGGSLGLANMDDILFEVYPVPATDQLTIRTEKEIQEVLLIDMSGRSYPVKLNNGNIDVGSFSRGIYLLQLEMPDGSMESVKIELN